MVKLHFLTALALISVASARLIYDDHGTANTDDQKKAIELTEIFSKQFETWAYNIEKEIEEFKGKTAVKEFGESFDKSIDELKATVPNKRATVTEYVENVGKTAEEVLMEIKNLAETAENEQNKKFFKKFLESTSGAFNNIVQQIKEGNQQLTY